MTLDTPCTQEDLSGAKENFYVEEHKSPTAPLYVLL